MALSLIVFISLIPPGQFLNNGLALTPPMGWLAWEHFKCNTNCYRDPGNCISENLFMKMADLLIADGFRDAGYRYINIDDCWMSQKRDIDGRMKADPERFPHGIKFLAKYMHERDLKLGIYQDFGTLTCMGYPGIVGHMELDARTFADWGVDMVKLDGCHSSPKDMDKGYMQFGHFLNKTGRPMVYSCSWPYYQLVVGMEPNYTNIAQYCNLWRNYDDIQVSWESIQKIIDFYGDNQEVMVPHAGPGHWNDPDMNDKRIFLPKCKKCKLIKEKIGVSSQHFYCECYLSTVQDCFEQKTCENSKDIVIGNPGLDYKHAKVQMAIWAIIAAPLLMSNDLREITPELKDILLNKDVISINQDKLGIQGKRIYQVDDIEIWIRTIMPSFNGFYSRALAFINRQFNGHSVRVSITLSELGLNFDLGYDIRDTFTGEELGTIMPNELLTVSVDSESVTMILAKVVAKSSV